MSGGASIAAVECDRDDHGDVANSNVLQSATQDIRMILPANEKNVLDVASRDGDLVENVRRTFSYLAKN